MFTGRKYVTYECSNSSVFCIYVYVFKLSLGKQLEILLS